VDDWRRHLTQLFVGIINVAVVISLVLLAAYGVKALINMWEKRD
jgi:hypothetical protein